MWDALKAFLRGIFIQQKIKNTSREWENKTRKELVYAEKEYVEDPSLEKKKSMVKQATGI